jgi:hypothetical protein
MKTTDFTTTVTADTLNESMFKKFGSKVNFNKYTREELENYRNILRTKVHQTETGAKFNELLSNEDYQKNKHMLELLNTKIKEMLGEGAKVDRQAAHITKSMMKKGKSKDDAESIAWAHIKHPKKKTTKAEEGIEETTMIKNTTEGKRVDRTGDGKKDFDDVQVARLTAGGVPKKKAIAKATSDNVKEGLPMVKGPNGKMVPKFAADGNGKNDTKNKKTVEGFPTVDDAKKAAAGTAGMKQGEKKKSSTGGEITKTATGLRHSAGKNYGGQDAPKAPDSDKKSAKKKVSEQVFKLHVRLVNESLRYLINEDEEGKAKAITAASDMVNDFTTWMQRVGQYQTKAIVELADAIRSDFGEQEAEAFKQTVSPALSATLDVLTQQREAISHAVAVLAGEATEVPQMGAEPGMGEPPMDGEMPMDVEPDSMNPPEDEFGASDAAAGGAEAAGREVRESRFIRKIAESHSIMSKLSR